MISDEPSLHCDSRGDILFIASANPEHVRVALSSLRESYPRASFDAVTRQEAVAATTEGENCRVVHVTGAAQGRVELIRRLSRADYATVAFVEAGSGGYIALQVLPFFLGINTVILVDEAGSIVPIRASASLAHHAANRLKKQWKAIIYSTVLALFRTIFTPVGLVVLLLRTAVVLARRRPTPLPFD